MSQVSDAQLHQARERIAFLERQLVCAEKERDRARTALQRSLKAHARTIAVQRHLWRAIDFIFGVPVPTS